MQWCKQGRKKPSSPARIAALREMLTETTLLLLNLDFSVTMSHVTEQSFELPEKKKNEKKEKRGGQMIKCLLTEFGWAGRENTWHSSPPTQSTSTYSVSG